MKGLLDIQPQLKGYEEYGPEPSLRELVYQFYEENYPAEAAVFSQQYFERLFQQRREEI